MAPAMGSSTPSPPRRVHTPPTPKHGFSDHWKPFSPRKSARIAQRAANKTPPPPNSASNPDPFGPAKTTRTQNLSSAGMVSPSESPKKKSRMLTAMDGDGTTDDASKVSSSLNADDKTSTRQTASATISRTAGMLPTPAKTPKKAPAEKNPAIQGVARNLFASDDEAMPNRKSTRAKKYTGISLDSFRVEEEPIEIFTDSKERIPQKEESADNPFYGKAGRVAAGETVLRRSKRNHVHVPGEGRQTIDEAMKREDGLVYVFRGKKTFRKFAETELSDADDDDSEARSGSPTRRRMTRSSIKPRLLFPPKERSQATLEEEEADTDIEADVQKRSVDRHSEPQFETPSTDSRVDTPAAPGYSPVPLPETRRVTRARDRKSDKDTPIKKTKSRTSPFDSWPRVKSRSDSGVPSKRAGSSLVAANAKKVRT